MLLNPLQYSCLENPMDKRAWPAIVHGVSKSQMQLSGTLNSASIVNAVEQAGYGASPKTKEGAASPKTPVNTAQDEYKGMKKRLLLSAVFTIPLFYISMGHMMNWPLPGWLLGMENAISFPVFIDCHSNLTK